MNIPPSVVCPTDGCVFVLNVLDDCCPACGTCFTPHELWDVYEEQYLASHDRYR